MLVNPQQKLKNQFFYNNICIIVCIFCIVCFSTADEYIHNTIKQQYYNNIKEGALFGPIEVKNKNAIYQLVAEFTGDNSNMYITGEVLDEDKDTIYEFGKDLWHESGYDGGEYYSESERKMSVDLTFSEKGKYYLQLQTELPDYLVGTAQADSSRANTFIQNLTVTLKLKKGSYIPHLQLGISLLFLLCPIWWIINRKWMRGFLSKLNDVLEEMSDD